jgi:hypothetical protein
MALQPPRPGGGCRHCDREADQRRRVYDEPVHGSHGADEQEDNCGAFAHSSTVSLASVRNQRESRKKSISSQSALDLDLYAQLNDALRRQAEESSRANGVSGH